MTGEMGTLASYDGAEPLFARRSAAWHRASPRAGHVGYVNLNMIVNERGVWPLEFTCRFGNPGFAILAPLQRDGWGDLFDRMLRAEAPAFATRRTGPPASCSPFPPSPPSNRRRPGRRPAGLLPQRARAIPPATTTGTCAWTAGSSPPPPHRLRHGRHRHRPHREAAQAAAPARAR